MNKIIINREFCNGCKICFESCSVGAIGWNNEKNKPVEANPVDCILCMLCENNCVQKALYIVDDHPNNRFPPDNVPE